MKRLNYHIIRKVKIVFVTVFLLSLSLPIIDWITPISLSTEYDATENRALAKRPKLTLRNITEFPNQFEKYFNDNMNFRENLLEINASLGIKKIDKKSNAFVHQGSNGWCYIQKYIKAYENKKVFSENQLDTLKQMFAERGAWLKKRGIKSYIAIVPTKAHIYPEYLPSYIFQYQRLSRTSQFFKLLSENNNIKGIDLSESLLAAKKEYPEYPLFYKTDQHWNKFGALVGLKQIIDTISEDFPEFAKININNYNITKEQIEGKQMAEILKKKKQLSDFEITVKPKESSLERITQRYNYQNYQAHPKFPYPGEFIVNYLSDNKKPKILLIRDSYSNALRSIFKEGCGLGDIVLVWDNWCYRLNEDIVEKENPKIHLTILIDGNLEFVLSHSPDNK